MTVCGEKVTGVCVMAKCPHIKRCCPVVWDKYGKIKPKTNEEWFCGLSTEEKARFIARYGIRRQVLHSFEKVGDSIRKSTDRHLGTTDIYEPIEEWLKQPHK